MTRMHSMHEELVEKLIRGGYLKTPRIIEAFRKINRADFVLDEYRSEAYGNYPLPIGFGQTISQPLTVAFMLELLAPLPGDRILEIGSGSGWATALLASIVKEAKKQNERREAGTFLGRLMAKKPGKVVAIERLPALKEMAEENVQKYGFIEEGVVQVVLGDGAKGYEREAPFDKVIAAATTGTIPVAWKTQCKIGGRIVVPIGESIMVFNKRSPSNYIVHEYAGFRFVPLVRDSGGG